MEFNFKISSGIKTLPIDRVFSSWIHVIKKAPIIICSRNSKSLTGIYFFFQVEISRKSVFLRVMKVVSFLIYVFLIFLFFFQEKAFKFVHAQIMIFRGLTCDFFFF